jgi:serine/threonine protein kinase
MALRLRAASSFASPDVVPWDPKCPKCERVYALDMVPKDWTCVQCSSRVWQPDHDVDRCMACRQHAVAKFSRHHCRKCGNVVCDACSKFKMVIPEWGNEKRRVCNKCAVPNCEVVKEGYLSKLGSKGLLSGEKLQKRFFQLRGTFLVYANVQHGAYYGCVNISRGRVMEEAAHENALCLIGPLLARGYILSAATHQEKQEWKQALEEVLRKETASALNGSLAAGRTDDEDTSRSGSDSGSRGGALRPAGSLVIASRDFSVPESALMNHAALRSEFERNRRIGIRDFELLRVIGKGECSRVLLARRRASMELYAMKIIDKSEICFDDGLVNRAVSERATMELITLQTDPALRFTSRLQFAFQSKECLFLVTEFCPAGDLSLHLQLCRRFSELRARLYIAEIAVAMDALHRRGYVYRDLRPENVLMRADGHVVLTDFAWCEDIGPEATATDPNTVKLTLVHKATQYGTTPEYAAPEVIDRDGSTVASDWWSLGVLLYEFVAGILPFTGQSMTELQAAIIGTQVRIPDFFSAELKSLISKLLERHPEQRLQRLQDLFAHPFFKGLAQGRVVSCDTKPEFVPELANAVEVKYFAPAVTQLPIPSYLDQPTDPRDLSHLAGYVYPRHAVDTVGDAAVAAADGGR